MSEIRNTLAMALATCGVSEAKGTNNKVHYAWQGDSQVQFISRGGDQDQHLKAAGTVAHYLTDQGHVCHVRQSGTGVYLHLVICKGGHLDVHGPSCEAAGLMVKTNQGKYWWCVDDDPRWANWAEITGEVFWAIIKQEVQRWES